MVNGTRLSVQYGARPTTGQGWLHQGSGSGAKLVGDRVEVRFKLWVHVRVYVVCNQCWTIWHTFFSCTTTTAPYFTNTFTTLRSSKKIIVIKHNIRLESPLFQDLLSRSEVKGECWSTPWLFSPPTVPGNCSSKSLYLFETHKPIVPGWWGKRQLSPGSWAWPER